MAIHFLFGLIFPLERTVTAVPPTITTTPSAAFSSPFYLLRPLATAVLAVFILVPFR